ncbi:Fc.00g072180.m01.CDS01 [Cosmosporella sp. VM-42]
MAPDERFGTKVYRLRWIPEHLDRLGVADLIGTFLPEGSSRGVTIASLALSCDFWSVSPSKTATLTFSELPEIVRAKPLAREWRLPSPGLPRDMVLDDSFFGLTPLNDVLTEQHQHDCVVLSGLASHPMGSWQPRGQDKSFMWIRDSLPKLVPGVRFIIYGYDTALADSESFQNVPDLAVSLINEMKAGGWTSSAAKSLVFFAHSLGGVVLKQTFVMLASSSDVGKSMLERIRGVIFFGVPSQGMQLADIFNMLGSQPNKDALVKYISTESQYLHQLERQVFGISYVRRMKLFWSYETQTTPTLVQLKGTYQRSGPGTVLVSKQSATAGRCDSEPASTIQIDSNHSEMVKFSLGNHLVSLIAHKLREMLEPVEFATESWIQGAQSPISNKTYPSETPSIQASLDPTGDPHFWDVSSIAKSLRPQERDLRLEQIDERTNHTFEWVFEHRIGLTAWLQKGTGLFWINGRPASGKSTLMKFINNDSRTRQFLQGWQSEGHQARASFFFHHRGNAAQKSFEGLLQSILSQLLESDQSIFIHIMPILQERYIELLEAHNLSSLLSDLRLLMLDNIITMDGVVKVEFDGILETQPRKRFNDIVVSNMPKEVATVPAWALIERDILSRKDDILKATNKQELRNIQPPIYQEEWNNETREHFLSLLFNWRCAIDWRGKLESLVQLANARSGDANKIHSSQERRDRISKVVQRQHDRELLRATVETEIWSRPKLDRAFKYIIEQQIVDRDLCLFLDALDEYDGPPEFIAEFLKDLVRERDGSRTRVRILFSSRPWNVFVDEFHQHPGIRIHEHTLQDVRIFCAHNINVNLPGSKEIIRLIGKIVEASRGVFLWVKLVLQDLADLAARCIEIGLNEKMLRYKLDEKFNSIPLDLVDYYGTIIDRIPQIYRWEAYCLLETVCRSYYTLQAKEVLDILRCSAITEFCQLQSQPRLASRKETESHIRSVSGGLLEIVEAQSELTVVPQLQLLHQTMLEFVRRPLFKEYLLGPMSHITGENGHSFLTKYLLYRSRCQVSADILRHAHESESTTGVSAYDLLHAGVFTITSEILHDTTQWGKISPTAVSPVGFAVAGLLHLFIKEALEHDKNVIANAPDSFLSLIHWSFDHSLCDIDEAVAMIRFLSSHGFRAENDADGLSKIIARDRNAPIFHRPYDLEQYDKLAEAALSGCVDLEMSVPCLPVVQHSMCLHLSSPVLTEYLLKRGANPNSVNSAGQTPLDFAVHEYKSFLGFSGEQLYQKSVLIVQEDGLLHETSRETWTDLIREFDARGFDTSLFRQRKFPTWLIRRPPPLSSLPMAGGFAQFGGNSWWPWSG